MQCFCVGEFPMGLLQDAIVAAGLCNAELGVEGYWLFRGGANTVLQLVFAPSERLLEVRVYLFVSSGLA